MTVTMQRISQSGRDNLCVNISVDSLLSAMSEDAKKEFVGYAVESGELLKILCYHIASSEDRAKIDPPLADVWLCESWRGELREAIAPLLGNAIAEELKIAHQNAERNRVAADMLRSLVHINSMIREEKDTDFIVERGRQWREQWAEAENLFPEFAPKKATKEVVP